MVAKHLNNTISKLRVLLNITEGEGKQLGFFLLLFACLGMGMAIGRGSADALFLKRYGVEYLPIMYITLSVTLALISTLYAAFVDRLPPEKFFQIMLLLQTVILFLFWLIINLTDLNEIFPAYYLLYEIISEVMLVHAAFYIDQNLDTMQSKRLTPLIFAGYQSGMILGGIILASVAPSIGVQHAPVIWSVFILSSCSLLFIWHRKKGVSPFYYPPSKSRRGWLHNAANEIRHGTAYIKQSPLLKDASFALFFMVIAFYALSFSINKIYTEKFTSEADLTAFFGLLVAGTNALALTLQVFVSSRVIEKIGVRKTKFIFPLTTIASFITLIVNPGFYAGIAASINKDSIMPAFRNPSRQMFFKVLPDYMRGRARASAIVLVLPIALLICGLLILVLQHIDITLIYYLGLACSLMYLYFCHRMGKNYINTLIDNMKERLFIPKGSAMDEYHGHSHEIYKNLLNGLNNENDQVSLSYARLLESHFQEQAVDDIQNRIVQSDIKTADQMIHLIAHHLDETSSHNLLELSESKDEHFKATVLGVIFNRWSENHLKLIEDCLSSNSARIQSVAISSVISSDITHLTEDAYRLWLDFIDGNPNQKLVALDLIHLMRYDNTDRSHIIDRYKHCIETLLCSGDTQTKLKVYWSLKHWHYGNLPDINNILIRDTSHHNHKVRSSAVRCLFLLESIQLAEPYLLSALDDGHLSVRQATHDSIAQLSDTPYEIYLSWVEQNAGSPRAQIEIVKQLISHGAEHSVFNNIIKTKIEFTLKLVEAIQVLDNHDHDIAVVSVINITLKERLSQIIDLVLLSLEPLVQSDIISVVRAGFKSRDASHLANAREALQGINDKNTIRLLNTLMDQKNNILTTPKNGILKTTPEKVIVWCTNINDQWLQSCGQYALKTMEHVTAHD